MRNQVVNLRNNNYSYNEIESKADSIISQYEEEFGKVFLPPIPVEKIIDLLLKITIDWAPIADNDSEPILATINSHTNVIKMNINRLPFFEEYIGSKIFTLGHELGHYCLHFDFGESKLGNDEPKIFCRMNSEDFREIEANQFSACLLMPKKYIDNAIQSINIENWRGLYHISDRFGVTISAITRRLRDFGIIKIQNKKIIKLI